MDPKSAALIWRFIVGLLITELPIVSYELQQPAFDWRFLAAGLIGGLVAALEKYAAPQLADTLVPPASDHDHDQIAVPVGTSFYFPRYSSIGPSAATGTSGGGFNATGGASAGSPPDPTATPGQP